LKAISLTQPWASLVAIGAKNIETRSWSSNYRGWLAIHASKGFPLPCRHKCFEAPFFEPLHQAGLVRKVVEDVLGAEKLPLGAIIAVANLHKIEQIRIREYDGATIIPSWVIPAEEIPFGDYTPGRYAWVLTNSRPLKEPIPCRGALSLWEVDPGIEERVMGQLA
jgi:activating signal cointegrator 1